MTVRPLIATRSVLGGSDTGGPVENGQILLRCAIGLLILAWLVLRALQCRVEAINWDEFALLARAQQSLATGVLLGGGRPGLVTALVMPFVHGCADSVDAVYHARLFWVALVAVYLAGVFFLVRDWLRAAGRSGLADSELAVPAASLAVGLLALMPTVVSWSIQVRTDQPALTLAVWGGVLLISPRRGAALAAGALFGLALLCSQKAAYVIALAGLLRLCLDGLRESAGSNLSGWWRAVLPVAMRALLGLAACLLIYWLVVRFVIAASGPQAIESALSSFENYRSWLGFRVYIAEAAHLPAHGLLLTLLLIGTILAGVRRTPVAAGLFITAWLILALGYAVAWFHAAAFAYFTMTLGLFLAVALGLSIHTLPLWLGRRTTAGMICLCWILLLIAALPAQRELLAGTQAAQRASTAFVERGGLRDRRAYQVEGALFCRADPAPLPAMFGEQIARYFQDGDAPIAGFINEFTRRPVAFFIYSFRMNLFPDPVKQFWAAHYVHYRHAVWVAGTSITAGTSALQFDAVADGTYRWWPNCGECDPSIEIDGATLVANATIALHAGPHQIRMNDARISGILALDQDQPPDAAMDFFYDQRQVSRIIAN